MPIDFTISFRLLVMRRLHILKLITFVGVAALLFLLACSSRPETAPQTAELPTPTPTPEKIDAPVFNFPDVASPESVEASSQEPLAIYEPEVSDEPSYNPFEGEDEPIRPEDFPTPLPIPYLALEGGVGDLVCSISPDTSGNSALSVHWTIDVDAGETGIVDYPFASGDTLELSVFGQKINGAYMEDPQGQRIVAIEDTLRPWNGEIEAGSDGRYRFYFDNTGGDEVKIMHLVITYHIAAPGSVILAPHEDAVRIQLPAQGSQG